MVKTARHRTPDRNRQFPPKIETPAPQNAQKSKTDEKPPDEHLLETKIKFELIGCIIWILGHGIHQIQTGRVEHSAVYKLCAIPVLMSTFINSLAKLDIYLHNCAKNQVSRPASTISVVLPTMFLLHKLDPSNFLQNLLIPNSICCSLLIFLPKVFTIGEAYMLSAFPVIYQVSSIKNPDFNKNSIPSSIISLIFAIILAIIFHKSTMKLKMIKMKNGKFKKSKTEKIQFPVFSLIILGLTLCFSFLDLTQFTISSLSLACQIEMGHRGVLHARWSLKVHRGGWYLLF